ncbi:MAG: GerMN domain-containing protein [Spirochaetaceae bacterium]|nr:GerMN domain-containing protein [Spirochaetaceae bacterium]
MRKNPYKTIYKEPLPKEAKAKIMRAVLFWAAFGVFITALFMINMPRIRATMRSALWPAWFKSRSAAPFPASAPPLPAPPPAGAGAAAGADEGEGEEAVRDAPAAPGESRAAAAALAARPQAAREPEPPPSQTARERSLYFIQLDPSGALLRAKVTRKAPASNAPLLDALEALLQGPLHEERRQGIISLIPQGTRILSASVVRDTAYISISEDFQYNTFGVEGYAAQLVQIVWTATEFANIKDVQILVEGRRIDYLGEGIWIGSPITRDPLRGF